MQVLARGGRGERRGRVRTKPQRAFPMMTDSCHNYCVLCIELTVQQLFVKGSFNLKSLSR